MEDREITCFDCGNTTDPDFYDEGFTYKEQYACGEHWICNSCGKEICVPHQEA